MDQEMDQSPGVQEESLFFCHCECWYTNHYYYHTIHHHFVAVVDFFCWGARAWNVWNDGQTSVTSVTTRVATHTQLATVLYNIQSSTFRLQYECMYSFPSTVSVVYSLLERGYNMLTIWTVQSYQDGKESQFI